MIAQKENIKTLFEFRPNQWIPLPEIMQYAAQYNARIFELRRDGMDIINKKEKINGVWHAWYKWNKPEANGQNKLF